MPEEQAAALFWVVDTRGLITQDRGDKLAAHKVYFARKDNKGEQFRTLADVIEYVKPTCLIGLSTQRGTFTPAILRRMAELNENPVIFPLSNPADNAECTFEEAMIHTDNRAIFASGTGFPPYIVPGTGEVKIPGQGNNMYIFPGLGLGATLARPPTISNAMIYTTARSLANTLTPAERSQGLLYPHLTRIREVSAQVAAAVCLEAVRTGVARNEEIVKMVKGAGVLADGENAEGWKDFVRFVRSKMWEPEEGYGSDITIRERN
jgi:malate dehydrogenase (oxaloacetate-decarboxylating)(NADP+)